MAVVVENGKKILVPPVSAEDLKDCGILHAGSIIRWVMKNTKWYRLDRPPLCVWKNSSTNLSKRQACALLSVSGKTLVQVCTGVFLFYKSHLFVYLRGRKNRTKGTLLVAKGTSLMARRAYDRDHRPAYSTTGYVYR